MNKDQNINLKKYTEYFKDDLRAYDAIIVGSGISGLLCALNISRNKKIALISKSKLSDNNSSLAQGGIAASIGEKNRTSHIEDTLRAGSYINDIRSVEKIIDCSEDVINNLIELGVEFDRDPMGNILFTKEGGHSERRILHCKDSTGKKIIESLIERVHEKKNIEEFEDCYALDIITSQNIAYGVLVNRNGSNGILYSRNLVLATGGIGELYGNTTNIKESTGDGIAMAIRAGARVSDMEFVQFHPTAFNMDNCDRFLISEALRGEGAKLINSHGEYFMKDIHDLGDLAPRDVVSQSIFREIQNGAQVFLDIRHKNSSYIKNRFPNIYNRCLEHDVDITKDLVPVTAVQHYFMGGIKVNMDGMTSIDGLYAIGECSNTGAHGANRLASNSLLESAAFALIVSREINFKPIKKIDAYTSDAYIEVEKTLNSLVDKNTIALVLNEKDYLIYKSTIQEIMKSYAFIEKTRDGLEIALEGIIQVENSLKKYTSFESFEIFYYELINMITVSKEIIKGSIKRKNSIGSHKISDRSIR